MPSYLLEHSVIEAAMEVVAAGFALLLAAAVLGKLVHPHPWSRLAARIGGGPIVAAGVPLAEAAVAGLLVARPAVGLAAAALLLASFATAAAVLRGRLAGEPCGCFGSLLESRIGTGLALRNGVLAALAALASLGAWPGGDPLGVGDFALAVAVAAPTALALRSRAKGAAARPVVGSVHRSPRYAEAEPAVSGEAPGRSSRRAILVSVAQGVLLVALGTGEARGAIRRTVTGGLRGPARNAWRRASATEPTFDKKHEEANTYKGRHCDKFADFLERKGVTDANGQNHPADENGYYAGYTWAKGLEDDSPNGWKKVRASGRYDVTEVEEEKSWYCPCDRNRRPYSSPTECLEECTSGVGCFAQQCQVKVTRVCLTARANVSVRVPKIVVSVVQWQPPRNAPEACHELADGFNRRNLDHEMRHADDINEVVDDVNSSARYQDITLRACGKTRAEAEQKLREQLTQRVDAARQELWRREQQKRDSRHVKHPDVLDCRRCP